MKASDLFVRCLEEEGVEYVFGVPGEENLDLLESLRESRVQLVVTRHEQHAAFMAATYGRLTGRAGVCLSTLGPGATNLLTGVAYAQLGGMPLLAITGQKAIRDNRQGKFQLIDVVDTFQPVTKWAYSITDSGVIPRCVRHAFKLAESERPGAVHLELPEDIAGEDIAPSVPQRRITLRRPNADDQATQQAADMIRAARQPIIIYSAGANRKRITEQLEAFVEATGLFAIGTQMGKGVLADDHPQSLFCMGIHKHDYVHSAIDEADLVITLGYDVVEYPPAVWSIFSLSAIARRYTGLYAASQPWMYAAPRSMGWPPISTVSIRPPTRCRASSAPRKISTASESSPCRCNAAAKPSDVVSVSGCSGPSTRRSSSARSGRPWPSRPAPSPSTRSRPA